MLDWTRLDNGQDQGSDHGLHHRPNKKVFKKLDKKKKKKKNIYIYIYICGGRVYLGLSLSKVLNAVVEELSIHKLKN